MMTSSELSTQKAQCPYCNLAKVKRHGNTIKGARRFFCYNCQRFWQDSYIRVTTKVFDEQKELLAWAQTHPKLANHLLTIAENGHSNIQKMALSKLKNQGCNVLLAYPMDPYHGLWIGLMHKEAKCKLQKIEPSLQALQKVGYKVNVAHGWREAANQIKSYLAWNK